MASPSTALYQTTSEIITENAFYIVQWLGVGLCTLAFSLRAYIRFLYFRRLLVDDYMMLVALLMLVAIAVVNQLHLSDIYLMIHVQNGVATPGADFLDRMSAGLAADGVSLLLSIIGIWVIKLNFLLFFYRIGHMIIEYLIFWWVALIVVVGCGAAGVGVIPYSCVFGDIDYIIGQCSTEASVAHIYTVYKVSVILDVCSDALIICFPVVILWKTRISMRQKFILSGIFCLVGFTIGVSIIRGSIFGGVYKSLDQIDRKVLDTTWALFWFYIEYIVSFIVACLVSFRSLWARKDQKAREQAAIQRIQEQTPPLETPQSRFRARMRRIHDSVLDTFNDFDEKTVDQAAPGLLVQEKPMDLSHGTSSWSTTSRTELGMQTRTGSESGASSNQPHHDAESPV